MSNQITLLPCGGFKKIWGLITQEIAFRIAELDPTIKIVCTPLHATSMDTYRELISNSEVFVIDGCASRCAIKMLKDYEYKSLKRIYIPDEAKDFGITIKKSLRITDEGRKLADLIAKKILKETKEKSKKEPDKKVQKRTFQAIDFYEVTYDKFKFKVPKKDYLFIDNDSWIKVDGNKALVGISDYFQTKASDILFIDLPEVNSEYDQFAELVDFESVKAVLSLILPVSGRVIAINEQLNDEPELLNSHPYTKGWVVEIEMADFEEDKELLMSSKEYFEFMKRKIESEL